MTKLTTKKAAARKSEAANPITRKLANAQRTRHEIAVGKRRRR